MNQKELLRQYWADNPSAFDGHPDHGAMRPSWFPFDPKGAEIIRSIRSGGGYVLPDGLWVFPGDDFVTEVVTGE